jgi:hypothetical protein
VVAIAPPQALLPLSIAWTFNFVQVAMVPRLVVGYLLLYDVHFVAGGDCDILGYGLFASWILFQSSLIAVAYCRVTCLLACRSSSMWATMATFSALFYLLIVFTFIIVVACCGV